MELLVDTGLVVPKLLDILVNTELLVVVEFTGRLWQLFELLLTNVAKFMELLVHVHLQERLVQLLVDTGLLDTSVTKVMEPLWSY